MEVFKTFRVYPELDTIVWPNGSEFALILFMTLGYHLKDGRRPLDEGPLLRTLEMKTYTAVVEKCSETGLYVGFVPGFPGAHTQGESLDELGRNLQEVIEMLLEEGEPVFEGQFVGTQQVVVA